ncbi:FAD-dependent oxidoreductase [Streptomyces sp. NPDC086554]|uniref:NAD(P)/FAD-dependent oxidoreductase n=1 Tax=Streptomyces sp. NPDC086554 TaxID=3154864 RepID=UPI0034409E6F
MADHQIPELLAGTGVEFVRGTATGIDITGRTVAVRTPEGAAELPYDSLVYAIGSSTDTDADAVPGAAEYAETLNSPAAAHHFATRLARLAADGGTVAVCGGGLTGIEAATEIAESHPGLRVTLISRGEPGAMMGRKARAHLHAAFGRLGITLRAGSAITKVPPDGVELADGRHIASDVCLWTTGVRVSALAADSGIAVDGRGLILVDATLRSTSHPEIHAIGDAAAVRQAWGQVSTAPARAASPSPRTPPTRWPAGCAARPSSRSASATSTSPSASAAAMPSSSSRAPTTPRAAGSCTAGPPSPTRRRSAAAR